MVTDYISAIFFFADADGDNCATKDEMVGIFEWGTTTDYTYYIEAFFGGADADGDGLATWSELQQWMNS